MKNKPMDTTEQTIDSTDSLLSIGRRLVQQEAQALAQLAQSLDASFATACRHMLQCQGRVIVVGMGKSGHIGNKIAATLASTGTPAFFVHPGEAGHGDLGMITAKDVVLAISYSGETQEIMRLLPMIRRIGASLIAMTGRPQSNLAMGADLVLNIAVTKEACPLGLAPTSSTTASLVLGDALAVALLKMRGLTAEQFALSHPCGSLGRRLLRVTDVMHRGEAVPTVTSNRSISYALLEITAKRFGMTLVINPQKPLIEGVFTDGDLRRTLDRGVDIHGTPIGDAMTTNFLSIQPGATVEEALTLMQSERITAVPVTDLEHHLLGLIHLHDLLEQ